MKPGDIVIGIPSSGPHSNGYSLIRKVLNKNELKIHAKALLAPTRIYVKEILSLLSSALGKQVSGIAHITGGSFYDKIGRIVPKGCEVVINKHCWQVPEIFKLIQKKGKIADKEIYRTLNMGIGMVVIVRPQAAAAVNKKLKGSRIIGVVEKGSHGVVLA